MVTLISWYIDLRWFLVTRKVNQVNTLIAYHQRNLPRRPKLRV